MYIWIDRITGDTPNDLRNINGLNHYIGMKPIEPENIPELLVFPVAVGVLAGSAVEGSLFAGAGSRTPRRPGSRRSSARSTGERAATICDGSDA